MLKEKLRAGASRPDAQLFELMADSVTDYAIFLLDDAGRIATWNAGAEAIKGYKPDEVIGKHFSLFYTPDDVARDWPAQELQRAALTGRFEDEGWRVKKDGSRFWANVIITALKDPDGTVLAYSKITRDLSERRMVEEHLRQSEERFRLLVEGVKDYAIYMLDPNGIVTSWNSGAEEITGYAAQEIIGKHFSTFYAPEDLQQGKPDAELALAQVHGRAEDEGFRVRKNGTRFWARVVVRPLQDSQGNLYGFAKVTQDLTQRKHAEALENVAQNINEFIAILAHELRNPLAPIRSAVNLLQTEPDLGADNDKVVQIIDRQSSQLMRIVDDIIDVSRITRGKFSIVPQMTKVLDIVTRSVEAARPGIDAKRQTLKIDISNAPLTILGDEARLSQALTNLLNNASRYTDPGGEIMLRVSTELHWSLNELAVSVKDNGRGIAPELMGAIFGMFVQGEDKRNISGAGLGVGLALAKSIVELHQGRLEATSRGLGKGSEFVIRIPMVQPARADSGAGKASEAKRHKLRVLVVDDNADAALLQSALLKKAGQEVLTAYTGTEALEIFDKNHPDLVLLDIGMPSMNGYELARHIRNHPYGKGTYLVAITGWGKDEDRYRSKESGIDLHLVKPVEARDILALLDSPAVAAAQSNAKAS
jgi:PAS domain S-box-containing protein